MATEKDRSYEVAMAEAVRVANLLRSFDNLQDQIQQRVKEQAEAGIAIKGSVDVISQLGYLSYDWLVKFLNDYKTLSVDALVKRIMELRRQQ